MADELRLDIDPPVHGWAIVRLTAPNNSLEFSASYTPRDSITDLARAASALLAGVPTAAVIWNTEPREFAFDFHTLGEWVELEIREFPDNRRGGHRSGVPVARIKSDAPTVARAVWRALRRLEGGCHPKILQWRGATHFPVIVWIGSELGFERRVAISKSGRTKN
jgi:hypothetical protein